MRLHRLFALLLLLAGCGDPSPVSSSDILFSASVDDDVPPQESNVDILLQNLSDRTVFVVDHCGEVVAPRFERREGGQWVEVLYGIPCFAMIEPPLEVEPGESASGYAAIHQPGRYRMFLRVAGSTEGKPGTVVDEFIVGI